MSLFLIEGNSCQTDVVICLRALLEISDHTHSHRMLLCFEPQRFQSGTFPIQIYPAIHGRAVHPSWHYRRMRAMTTVNNRSSRGMGERLSRVDLLCMPSLMRFMMKQCAHGITHHVRMMTSLTRYNVAISGHVWRHWWWHGNDMCYGTASDVCSIESRLGRVWGWRSDNTSARVDYRRNLRIISWHRILRWWSSYGRCRRPVAWCLTWVWRGIRIHGRTSDTRWSNWNLSKSFSFPPFCSTILKPYLKIQKKKKKKKVVI